MIKRYNQFIKKVNEAEELETPVKPEIQQEPAPTQIPDPRRERWRRDAPSVDPDPLAKGEEGIEDNLEYLHDTLEGSVLMNNILKYKGHEITLPSETGEFEVDGVRRIKEEGNKLVPTSSAEDVIDYLNNPEAQSKAQGAQAQRVQAQAQRVQGQAQAQRAQGQAQAQRAQGQAQFEEVSADELMRQLEDDYDGSKSDISTNKTEDFETQTGKDPEEEAREGEKVDVEQTGRKKVQGQFESKSYRSRFRTKF
jgi:hypothetical protein